MITKLKQEAGFSHTFEQERLTKFAYLLLDYLKQQVLKADVTGIALTHRDQDIVLCTLQAAQRSLDYNILMSKG